MELTFFAPFISIIVNFGPYIKGWEEHKEEKEESFPFQHKIQKISSTIGFNIGMLILVPIHLYSIQCYIQITTLEEYLSPTNGFWNALLIMLVLIITILSVVIPLVNYCEGKAKKWLSAIEESIKTDPLYVVHSYKINWNAIINVVQILSAIIGFIVSIIQILVWTSMISL